ncbi:hypothetical protein [Phocaeicola salanitronis]|uniref:hypothetical protein n=1 Tax=Phocaeicola salanitronis TaxID=376805 RepID=UPI0023F6C3E4|nr:hypothetical protein [Phocaeicola salanitronis]
MEHKEHIEAIIKRTFEIIKEVYDYQQEKFEGPKISSDKLSRIIFPQKRQEDNDNKQTITRVSEQELKLIFIEQLNLEICEGNWDVYYSVETPTEKKYRFTGEKPPKQDDSGRSANFDLVIHDNKFKRIALIEFKANNPKSSDYLKDFVKLNEENYEGKVLRYFIEIVKNADSGTSNNLQEKVKGNEGIFWCYSLEKGEIINSPIK